MGDAKERGFLPTLWPPVSIITARPCAQVAGEVLEELCGQMGITDLEEVQEFALFIIKGEGEPRERDSLVCPGHCLGHRNADSVLCLWSVLAWVPYTGELVRPLSTPEYINNVMKDQDISLHSRRLGWETPLHFDNTTYIETHYGQVSPLPRAGSSCLGNLWNPLSTMTL